MRRKVSRDTSGRWFVAPIAGLASASTYAGLRGVLISNFVEEGMVEHVTLPEPTVSSSPSVKNPAIGSEKTSTSSGEMPRKQIEVGSPVTSPRQSFLHDPSFGAALDREASGSLRRSGAPPIFTFAKKE